MQVTSTGDATVASEKGRPDVLFQVRVGDQWETTGYGSREMAEAHAATCEQRCRIVTERQLEREAA